MGKDQVDTIVIGAGQAGIATSEHLSKHGIDHLVFERARIAEKWRTHRWDSLVANGPAWHDRFPGLSFEGHSPEAFVPKNAVVEYFETYVDHIKAPFTVVLMCKTFSEMKPMGALTSPLLRACFKPRISLQQRDRFKSQ